MRREAVHVQCQGVDLIHLELIYLPWMRSTSKDIVTWTMRQLALGAALQIMVKLAMEMLFWRMFGTRSLSIAAAE
jgi:hypothetical protein